MRLIFVYLFVLTACLVVHAKDVEIRLAFSSDKEPWIRETVGQFNKEKHLSSNGGTIVVRLRALSSGACINDLLAEKIRPHIVSPSSMLFVRLGNHGKAGLLQEQGSLLYSPIVIAAEKSALGALRLKGNVSWSGLHTLTQLSGLQGVTIVHGHPGHSSGGLVALLGLASAAHRGTRALTAAELTSPQTAKYLRSVEQFALHDDNPLSYFQKQNTHIVAILPEHRVYELRAKSLPVVAIHPTEGTIWNDHPVALVKRPWVKQEHHRAACMLIRYLLKPDRQEKALRFGFRPANPSVSPYIGFSKLRMDLRQPASTLRSPDAPQLKTLIKLWERQRRAASVVLVLDISGSMAQNRRIVSAKAGAAEMLDMMSKQDRVSLLVFNSRVRWLDKNLIIGTDRGRLQQRIRHLFPGGGTALYDAGKEAFLHVQRNRFGNSVPVVILLTDGEDTHSMTNYDSLINIVRSTPVASRPRIFTISYGKSTNTKQLQAIAKESSGKHFQGDTVTIREIFKQISTYF